MPVRLTSPQLSPVAKHQQLGSLHQLFSHQEKEEVKDNIFLQGA